MPIQASLQRLSQPTARQGRSDPPAEGREFLFAVPDMHCAGCISAVEKSLAALPEVAEARVNLSNRRVHVEARPDTDPDALIRQIGDAGFSASRLDPDALKSVSADHVGRSLLLRLGVAGFGFSNVMIFSVAVWAGAEGTTRDLLYWISALIAVPVVCFSAQPFFASAFRSLRRMRLNMDVPISLAIALAAAQSVFETYLGGPHAYFEAALALTFFLLAGRYLDHSARSASRSAAQQLSVLEPDCVTLIRDGAETDVPLGAVKPGDVAVVRSGDRIPLDGSVCGGSCEIDNSYYSGESRPQFVRTGDTVAAGQFVVTGRATLEVSATGEDSSLRQLIRLIALAESAKSRYTGLADKAAAVYAPAVHLLALAAFTGWMMQTGDVRISLNVAVAVLIITCPCALGLAVPVVSVAATGRLFRQNLLVKEPDAGERLASARTAILDKTGTLTTGRVIIDNPQELCDQTLAAARGLAETSNHPFSKSIVRLARQRGVDAADVRSVREIPGCGIEGRWNSERIRLGRPGWAGDGAAGGSSSLLQIGNGPAIALKFSDQLRGGAADCVRRLQAMGLRVVMISGDSKPEVERTAQFLNIGEWHAEMLPADKLRLIKGLSGGGAVMIGDGLNDAAAMAIADISMAPASSVDVTRVAAGIVILGDSLRPVPEGIRTARLARRRILENFAIAAAYNAIAVPIAVLGFASPLAAALAMSTSSIAVTLNSLRLR